MTVLTEPLAIESPKPNKSDFQAADSANKILTKGKNQKVCFVCTGNTCRSPMAMALYNHLNKHNNSYAISCGLYPNIGEPISANAFAALEEYHIPHNADNRYDLHKVSLASEDKLSDCCMIVGMTEAHTLELIYRFPRLASRIFTMPKAISDPYGGDLARYKQCLCEIESGLKELFSKNDNG